MTDALLVMGVSAGIVMAGWAAGGGRQTSVPFAVLAVLALTITAFSSIAHLSQTPVLKAGMVLSSMALAVALYVHGRG